MSIILDILRRRPGEAESVLQSFLYEPAGEADTVATALRRLNGREELRDLQGNPAEPVQWECSCLQKRCGACAMVINGRPGLACDVRLGSLRPKRGQRRVRLEPLRKFPVVADLVVDRSVLFRNLAEMELWFSREEEAAGADMGEQASETAYQASRCLQCGCCLEVCPNFVPGEGFFGMAAAVPAARLLAALPEGERQRLSAHYRERVYEGCGKSLSCVDICPAGIPADELMARSNAAAVWRRGAFGERRTEH